MEHAWLFVDSLAQGQWQSILLLTVGGILSYAILVCIYRVTLHPLAKYPGPLLSKLTGWSIVWQAASGDRHLRSWREHEIYGPIVRIGPNTLSINTISAVREIYGSRPAKVLKAEWYRSIDAPSGAFSTHSEIDDHKHAFRRRVLDHAFSDSALRNAEPFVVENVQMWCDLLGRNENDKEMRQRDGEWTEAKNMSDWATYLGYDVMGDLTFGKRFNCMESKEHRYVPELMMSSTKLIYVVGFLPCVKLVRPFLGTKIMDLFAGKIAREGSKYIKYANNQMAQRIAAENDESKPTRKDFMHYLLHAKDTQTGRGLTPAELNADSSLFISAGSDTTSLTMSAVLFYLLHYPKALAKATAEVRHSFGSIDEIRGGKPLNRLIYVRACIDEALRLNPPVPSHLPREVIQGGIVIDGEYFPKGTVLGTGAYAIHHNKEYYPDPFSFRPERWIRRGNTGESDGDEEGDLPRVPGLTEPKAVATARAAFFPFSIGPRGCIGKSVAYLELTLALATLLFRYDLRLPKDAKRREPTGEGHWDASHWGRRRVKEYQLVEHFLPYRDGPMVEFKIAGTTK